MPWNGCVFVDNAEGGFIYNDRLLIEKRSIRCCGSSSPLDTLGSVKSGDHQHVDDDQSQDAQRYECAKTKKLGQPCCLQGCRCLFGVRSDFG
jgi:hypothetical protein